MKFTVNRKELLTELAFLRPLFPRDLKVSSSLAISVNEDNVVSLIACNRQAQFETSLQCVGAAEPGYIEVVPYVLDQLFRLLTDETIEFETVKQGLFFRWTDGECRIQKSTTSMPLMQTGEKTSITIVDKAALESTLKRVEFALPPTTDLRFPGILVECGQKLHIVSIEGAALASVTSDTSTPYPCNFLLPVRAHERILWMLRENEATSVTLRFGQHLRAECGARAIVTPQSSGQLPAWQALMFDTGSVRADFPVDVALEAIYRAMTQDELDCARVGLRFKPGIVEVFTDDTKEELAAAYDGAEVEFSFKGKLLAGILESVGGPRVELIGKGPLHHVIFRPLGQSDDRFVLMPMQRK